MVDRLTELDAMDGPEVDRGWSCTVVAADDPDTILGDLYVGLKWEGRSAEVGYTFPYLYDESQDVAKAYKAACTPDFFLFDKDQTLAYRGQLDSSRPDSGIPVTGADLRAALDAVLAGRSAAADQKPSIGCNIKWKAGNEPEYFNPAGTG